MGRFVKFAIFNAALVGGVGAAQYNQLDLDRVRQMFSPTSAAYAARGAGSRMRRSGGSYRRGSRHK